MEITTLSIQKPNNDQSLVLYKELLENKDTLNVEGIVLVTEPKESLSPEFIDGLVVGIVSGLATNYITRFIDFVLELIKKRKCYGVTIIIKHQEKTFYLPKQRKALMLYLEEIEESNDG